MQPSTLTRYLGAATALRLLATAGSCLLVLGTGCARETSVDYRVTLSPAALHPLAITMSLNGVPKDSLVLRGYASSEILRISNLTASDRRGHPIPVVSETDSLSADGALARLPRFRLRGPLPSRLTIRYTVETGTREGDSHVGFTGRRYGYAGSRFAMITGRDLFLVPQPAEAVRHIEVRFALPDGWKAATPWTREGDHWRTEIAGGFAAEHLISAPIGMGRFHEHSFAAGGTTFRFAFEDSTPPGQEADAFDRLGRAARFVRGIFGRDLGKSYWTLVAPETPDGDEIDVQDNRFRINMF